MRRFDAHDALFDVRNVRLQRLDGASEVTIAADRSFIDAVLNGKAFSRRF